MVTGLSPSVSFHHSVPHGCISQPWPAFVSLPLLLAWHVVMPLKSFGEGIGTWIGWLQFFWSFNYKCFSTFKRVKWYICFVTSVWKFLLQILVPWEFSFLTELHKITCLHFLRLLCTGKQLSCYRCLNYLLLCWWVESMAWSLNNIKFW